MSMAVKFRLLSGPVVVRRKNSLVHKGFNVNGC